MAPSSQDVDVPSIEKGVEMIMDRVDTFLNTILSDYEREGVTKEMVTYCKEYVGPMLHGFEAANLNGATQKSIVIDKVVRRGGPLAKPVKECQLVVEIDADKENEKLNQKPHVGCEIYFANKEKCRGKDMEEEVARTGRRIFKMHAYLPEEVNLPHHRHMPGSEQSVVMYPASRIDDSRKDLQIVYRSKVTRTGCPQKRGQAASIYIS